MIELCPNQSNYIKFNLIPIPSPINHIFLRVKNGHNIFCIFQPLVVISIDVDDTRQISF